MSIEAYEGALPAAAVSISLGGLSEPFVLELHKRAVSSLPKAYRDEGLFSGIAFVFAPPTPRHLDQAGFFELEVLTHQADLGAVRVVHREFVSSTHPSVDLGDAAHDALGSEPGRKVLGFEEAPIKKLRLGFKVSFDPQGLRFQCGVWGFSHGLTPY